tara:strand:- start:1170 stop:1934 length:765 start_codon:yes stop_codon:yes gene_type:complete
MKILITNDDGIFHPGIYALYESVKSFGEIVVVAPSIEQSGMSHSISLNKTILLEKVSFLGQIGYSCTGTPVDCVKLALHELFDGKPDLVLSGINKGSNTSQNILYSGTVSAAVEGAFNGIPSIAISLTSLKPDEYHTATKITKLIIKKYLSLNIKSNTVININIPPIKYEEIKGIRITRQGKSKFNDSFKRNVENNSYTLDGELKIIRDNDGNDDHCVEDGFVSITPLQFNLTNENDYTYFKKIEFSFNENLDS